MNRVASIILMALTLSASVYAQPSPRASAAPSAHELPFPTATPGQTPETHTIELAVGGASEALSVHVAASPEWLVFSAPSADAEAADGAEAEPVARLLFSVAAGAPVGETAAVDLVVTDAAGVERARHTVRLVVAAPDLSLRAPWPNPSRGSATVAFTVPAAGPVRLSVVDVLGREDAVLAEGYRAADAHEIAVPTARLAAGTYAVRLAVGAERRVRRLTVVR